MRRTLTIATYESPAAVHLVQEWGETEADRIASWGSADGMGIERVDMVEGERLYLVPITESSFDFPTLLRLVEEARRANEVPRPFYKWIHFGKVPVCEEEDRRSILFIAENVDPENKCQGKA